MKIVILTIGSRGDVQPFVALALSLQAAGYDVTVCTAGMFESFVTERGLKFAYMNDDLIRLTETDEGKEAIESGGKWSLIKKVQPMIRKMLEDSWVAALEAEALIYHPKTLSGYHIAEKLNIPALMSLPLPLYTPTSAFPVPILPPNLRLGGFFNRLSYAMLRMVSAPYMGTVNNWRAETLGLPPRPRFANDLVRGDGQPVPVLYSYSPTVVPVPADWPETAHVTGYWFLDRAEDWRPSPELAAFLESGPAPVYVGFGSMAGKNPEKKARIVLDALAKSGQRGLIATGWGGMKTADLPESVFMIDHAPHDWLFPRAAAVVHHGGAGTTAAGLRAGKPTVICPFMGDQPFWGQRVYELGVGTAPIPQHKLNAENLAEAIHSAVSDNAMRSRAVQLGEKLSREDGVGQAVKVVGDLLGVKTGSVNA